MKKIISLILLALPVVGFSASFDCEQATGRVEKTICREAKLSTLDSELGNIYNKLSGHRGIKERQRNWLKSRNQCVTAVNIVQCIAKSYRDRLTQLHALHREKRQDRSNTELSIPVDIQTKYSINTGNWYPLPERDMKSAAVDTALSKMSETGYFSITQGKVNNKDSTGRMDFNISLIGPAEVAKLTLQLYLPNQPTFVSTSSISVRNMDYQGIYQAFEHIGRTAAERMLAKFNAYVMKKPEYKVVEAIDSKDDKKLQSIYDLAQKLKSRYKYQEARLIFEKIVVSRKGSHNKWVLLAKEELRYGLLIFEAKQSIVGMGKHANNPTAINKEITNAQNLLRQILADNTDNVQRMIETQRMLDNLDVSRNAVNVAAQQTIRIKVYQIKTMLEQSVAMEGKCDKESVKWLRGMEYVRDGKDKEFIIKDTKTKQLYRVNCSDYDIEVSVES